MRVIIAGSRDFIDHVHGFDIISSTFENRAIDAVVSGTARGADQLGEYWAESEGIPVHKFPADWG